MSEVRTNQAAGPAKPLDEVAGRLEQIARLHPDTRLTADLAHDALRDAGRQMALLAARIRRGRRKQKRQREHARELLDALASVPIPPWRLPALPADATAAYRALRGETLPALAMILHEDAKKGETRDYLLMLSEQVLRRGQRTLVEGLVRNVEADRPALCERVRPLIGGSLAKTLARQAGYRLTGAPGVAAEAALKESLSVLDALLHSWPAVRLFWARPGQAVDSDRHERGSGKAVSEDRVVLATLLPGLWRPAEGVVVEKALVATRRAGEAG